VSPAGSYERKSTTWHEAKNKNRGGRKHDWAVARCNRGDAFLQKTLVFEFVSLKRVLTENGTQRNPPAITRRRRMRVTKIAMAM
jgi:hypothetical protein